MKNRKIYLWIALGAAVVALGAGAAGSDFRIGRDLEVLVNMFRDINVLYVDEVDPDRLLSDAADGMTAGLDPYTEFISEEQMSAFELMTTGKYGGIGALIRKKDDWVVIAQPYKGFPADKAGLQVGDRILEINGKSARGFTTQQVSELLKGEPGTKLKLKVGKFLTDQEATLTLRRERIAISGVPYHGMVGPGIGYIRHSDFTEDCASDMRKALEELRRGGDLKGLVIDVRSNGGGILQEAVKILSMFVPKGTEVVSLRGKAKESDAVFRTENEPVDTRLPIVVLTNSGSASASEIVAGAMQDLDRAVLIGQRTFGKGLVQSTRAVGYNSYLKITTAKYYIPSGRCIQAIDYAHRNEDGSVASVPDSLMRRFTTRAGREVWDGGGVVPDIVREAEYMSRFAAIAYAKNYIADFADRWCKQHPGPVDPVTFRLSDAAYADFARFIEGCDMEYESETERALELLKKRATEERYAEKIGMQIVAIEKSLKEDKQLDLKLYEDELKEMIEDDIILRYHYSEGVARHRLLKDGDVLAAVELLGDAARYDDLLGKK